MTAPLDDRRGWRRLPDDESPSAARRAASTLYRIGVRLAATPWDLGWSRPRRVPWPVVSVGALTAGGAGKTPVVRWLAEALRERGFRPGILSRGYGGTGGSAARAIDPARPDARRDGDEPVLLARALRDVPVIVCPDRVRGAELAASRGAGVLLLDDGFQHRRLHRDFDLVLWDRRAERARGMLLPAGPLREPPSALGRADAVLRIDRGEGPPELPDGVATSVVARLVPGARQAVPQGTSVHALTGIADPASFERSLLALGLRITGATRFPDHHFFTAAEVVAAAERASAEGSDVLAVTAKDWVRWPLGVGELPVPCVFDLDVDVERSELLLERIAAIAREARR